MTTIDCHNHMFINFVQYIPLCIKCQGRTSLMIFVIYDSNQITVCYNSIPDQHNIIHFTTSCCKRMYEILWWSHFRHRIWCINLLFAINGRICNDLIRIIISWIWKLVSKYGFWMVQLLYKVIQCLLNAPWCQSTTTSINYLDVLHDKSIA